MNNFIYDIPTKVYFGEGQLGHLGEELKRFGKRVLLVYGGGSIKKSGLYDRVIAEIEKAGLELFECPGIEPNPRISSVNRGGRDLQEGAHRRPPRRGWRLDHRRDEVHRRRGVLRGRRLGTSSRIRPR